MSGLARKLLIFAAVDGLFLQPVPHLRDSNAGGIRIEYGTNRIVSTSTKNEGSGTSLEAHGIVGLLNLATSSYLISITRRDEVAQIRGRSIYRISDVTLIPLKSKEEAERAIVSAQSVLKQDSHLAYEEGEDNDVEDVLETASVASVDTVDDEHAEPKKEPVDEASALEPPKGGALKKSTTFVKDVVQDKGKYGRFASKWFSRNGSKESARRQAGMAAEEEGDESGLTTEQKRDIGDALPDSAENKDVEKREDTEETRMDTQTESTSKNQRAIEYLAPRILKSTRLYFSSSGFYFSYDHDVSRSLARQESNTTALWQRFDGLFFWNRNLTKPLIDAGADSYILPLMQGFVGQRSFTIAKIDGPKSDVVVEAPQASNETSEQADNAEASEALEKKHDLLLTLISRRSIKRAGLRYLRRGVDDEGSVANNVETEQILSTLDWTHAEKTFSLVQLRGSMPLFFSQSPYSFKPIPVFFGSEATNQAAFKKHFQSVTKRYDEVQCVSLVDKRPPENTIGELYEKHAKILNENDGIDGKQIGFEWFDFHGICKGMKFENVQVLMDTLQQQLDSFGWNEAQNDKLSRQQQGVIRTNCMDCLDRTNVVQSAIAGWALEQQLAMLGLSIDLKKDPKTQWFNTLWADNGDACSRQYAGTSALKGDFTRTRKRNWTGALSDFSLTLNRYYNNIFGDYFLQTNIDYYLGNAGPAVFDEFETDMMSQDYALDMRSIRQNAIDTCIKIVLEDPKEDLISGWTLSCPARSNTMKTLPFEECVLLLTDAALYFCRFDWDTEKVGSFERVDLRDVKAIFRGAYITSALGGTHLDENKNVGFALHYDSKSPSVIRTNTRSLSVAEGAEDANDHQDNDRGKKAANTSKQEEGTRLLAFKALPAKSVATKDEEKDLTRMSEAETIKHICEEIQRALGKVQNGTLEVEEKDLISVAEAKRSTGYIESLGYSLKKLVWS